MTALINVVETFDPNAPAPTVKQEKEIGNALIDKGGKESRAFAGEYIGALDDFQAFLVSELHIPPVDARNFVLDKFFIPLLKKEEKTQQTPNFQ